MSEEMPLISPRMSRRAVLRRAAIMGLSAPAIALLLEACGSSNSNTPTTSAGSAATSAATTSSSAATKTTTSAATPSTGSAATATRAASPASSPSASTSAASGTPIGLAAGWKPRALNVKLTGSGSSFVDPAMQLWVQEYKKIAPNVSINYQSVGSGQGKKDFIGNVTDFAGTDAYMTDDEMKQAPNTLHLPVVLGPVAITWNLPGITKLQLSGDTIAKIYLGTITKWDDAAIKGDNPGVNLPSTAITVAHRSDGSGTTAIFTNYLSKVSADWKSKVGEGTAVQWPVGIGGQQNPGVAAAVTQTPGGIGYVELAYALQNNLPTAAVKNATGNWVLPSPESASANAAGFLKDLPQDLRVFITNAPEGANAYPITGFSWLLLKPSYDDVNKAQALTDFCYWCMTQGQQVDAQLKYAPIPAPVQQIALQKLTTVQAGGQPAFTLPQ